MAGRLVRWVKRNRAVATVGAVAIVVLATTTVVLATKIINENYRANAELARRNASMAEITRMFGDMSADNMRQGMVDMGKVFDSAAQRMDTAPPAHPATEADFREFLAVGYLGLDMPAKAVAQQQRVVALREQSVKEADPVLAALAAPTGAGALLHRPVRRGVRGVLAVARHAGEAVRAEAP